MSEVAWRREFATEDEADVFYERLLREEDKSIFVIEPHRYSGHIVEVMVKIPPLERLAREVETSYTPLEAKTPCVCGHPASQHNPHDPELDHPCLSTVAGVGQCDCEAFDRADWPTKEILPDE